MKSSQFLTTLCTLKRISNEGITHYHIHKEIVRKNSNLEIAGGMYYEHIYHECEEERLISR